MPVAYIYFKYSSVIVFLCWGVNLEACQKDLVHAVGVDYIVHNYRLLLLMVE